MNKTQKKYWMFSYTNNRLQGHSKVCMKKGFYSKQKLENKVCQGQRSTNYTTFFMTIRARPQSAIKRKDKVRSTLLEGEWWQPRTK